MKALHLGLTNFRNYIQQELTFGDGVNVVYGDNAQGKTNILEAVYFFAMGKSIRAKRDIELINHNADSAKISLEFSDSMRTNILEAELFRDKRKQITANEVPIRKNSELVRRFNVVYFGPEYLGLVKEGPSIRRKNLDVLISQIKPGYISSLTEMKRIVESKNSILKMDNPNLTLLGIMNEKLAAVSANIIIYRSLFLDKIERLAQEIQNDISNGAERLEMKYKSCIGNVCGMDLKTIEDALINKIKESQARELNLRETVVGPHREDIEFFVNGYEAKTYASQGQQKTIVMAENHAEVALMNSETGDMPVLLLDDIMSEFDKSRREYILGDIGKTQIIITCTDVDGLNVPEDTCRIYVENGRAEVV